MALIDYTSLAIKVATIIDGTGKDTLFIKDSETPVDSAKPWRAYSTDTSSTDGSPGSGITAKAVSDEQVTEELQDSFEIRHGDSFFYVSGNSIGQSVDLREFDAVIDDGERYEIVKVLRIKPAAITLLYVVQARR